MVISQRITNYSSDLFQDMKERDLVISTLKESSFPLISTDDGKERIQFAILFSSRGRMDLFNEAVTAAREIGVMF